MYERMKNAFLYAAVAAVVIVAPGALADDDTPARATFTKDVLPILQENCQDCHRPKQITTSGMVAPFALVNYKEVRPWAKAIAKAVQSRKMPPWFASPEFNGHFRNERTLTDEEIATIVSWVETGAARGNPADAPEPRVFVDQDWWLGEPDLVVALPEPLWIADDVEDWQPSISIELTEEMLPEGKLIRTIECQPDAESVHHMVLYSQTPRDDASGRFTDKQIGGLAPGMEPSLFQEGYGIPLAKGTRLRVSMHYHKEAGPGTGEFDQSRIGFYFYDKEEETKIINIEPVGNMTFEVPPRNGSWTVGAAQTFNRPFTVLSMLPHMHLRGTAAKYAAIYPDGRRELLLDVPKYDYNWQLFYEYPEGKSFPAGTRLEVIFKMDNSEEKSAAAGFGFDPDDAVRFGLLTTDEMALGWLHYAWDDEAGTD